MNDFRKYYLALTLVSAMLVGCSGGGGSGRDSASGNSGGGDDGTAAPRRLCPPSMLEMIKMLLKMTWSDSELLPQGLVVTHQSPTIGAESTAPT